MSVEIEKLQQSNNELREIINNSWDGIGIIDENSKFIYINNAFSPILGYPKEEILKNHFYIFMYDEYKEPFLGLIKSTLKDKYSNTLELTCKRKDGKNVYLYVTLSAMLNQKYFVINAIDITKQKSDAMILNEYVISAHFDLKGNYTNVSDAFLYITGYDKNDIIDKTYDSILAKNNNIIEFEKIKKAIERENDFAHKVAFIKKDSSLLWVDAKIQPVYNKYGDTVGYTALMFDITQELILRDKNITLSNEVSSAKSEIQQKDKILAEQTKLAVMAETLQLISHEWRQPLNIISIKAQKLELDLSFGNDISQEEMIDNLLQIKQKADELSQTIEEFQSFVKLKDSKVLTSPKEIINKAVTIFSGSERIEGIDFIKDVESDIQISTYKNELATILVNILTNAKEAILRNNIKNGVIKLKEYVANNHLVFEISDNGGGIDESIMDKIFEPYFSTKEEKHGVGLGLYSCKIVIESHLNGTIEAKNHSRGATIKISLPI